MRENYIVMVCNDSQLSPAVKHFFVTESNEQLAINKAKSKFFKETGVFATSCSTTKIR